MPKPGDGQNIPTTSYAVLGLLTFGEMSGYRPEAVGGPEHQVLLLGSS